MMGEIKIEREHWSAKSETRHEHAMIKRGYVQQLRESKSVSCSIVKR